MVCVHAILQYGMHYTQLPYGIKWCVCMQYCNMVCIIPNCHTGSNGMCACNTAIWYALYPIAIRDQMVCVHAILQYGMHYTQLPYGIKWYVCMQYCNMVCIIPNCHTGSNGVCACNTAIWYALYHLIPYGN